MKRMKSGPLSPKKDAVLLKEKRMMKMISMREQMDRMKKMTPGLFQMIRGIIM
jgi:hypothetical protein